MSSSGKSPPRTRAEIDRYIDELTDADLVKLVDLATYRYQWALSRSAKGPEDLVQEAIRRTLAGKRPWRTNIDFLRHMDLAMKSIADSWRKAETEAPRLQCEFVTAGADGQIIDLYREAASTESLENTVVDVESFKQMVADLRVSLRTSDDLVCLDLFELFEEGYEPADMMETLELTLKQYEAQVRKLRRRAAKIYEGVKRG